MKNIRFICRLFRIFLHLFSGLFQMLIMFPRETKEQHTKRIQNWSKKILDIFNIELIVHNVPEISQTKNSLFISNHISWLDIFALNSVLPGRFVAKAEVRKWPIIGYLAATAGTVFIERRRTSNTQDRVNDVTEALKAGAQITLFPEGTTSNGEELLPFKNSFLQTAIDAESKIWPILCRYPNKDNSTNQAMAYYGDISLWQSLQMVAKEQEGRVELTFYPSIDATGEDRRELGYKLYDLLDAEMKKQQAIRK